ncbi:bifunctional DNA primase/polymerase [candidate division CSSED10-310 bacterium]|uniref:Bifunctional DNA primase/polymerase n=1 Tax=candidate division CSSED10-310 bacterium TaxID=2855610 RepID=A0ABV6Z061_UNCC1
MMIPAHVQPALDDYQSGIYSIPLPCGRKAPCTKGWQKLRLGPEDLITTFEHKRNRGRLLGLPPPEGTSGGFVICVDLDTPEAVMLGGLFLPPTGEVGGRADNPQSHWFYQCSPPPPTKRYTDIDGTRLLEVLSRGCQVLVPPSIHPCGQPYVWRSQQSRSPVASTMILEACDKLAGASFLARHWPQKGSRQNTALALAGVFLRSGWSREETEAFIQAVTSAAHDEETSKRTAAGGDTFKRFTEGETISGLPTLARLIGDDVIEHVRKWLHLSFSDKTSSVSSSSTRPPVIARPQPTPLGDAAYHGLSGHVVQTIAPHTEADPAALLLQFLTAFGNAVGHKPSFAVEATRHRSNVFCIIVGDSSKARKGTSWQHILRLFKLAAHHDHGLAGPGHIQKWLDECIKDGLSSGEGLIWHVRDPVRQWKASQKGCGRDVTIDRGITDKRLLIQTGEFIGSIRCMSRNGNTLSAILRSAWDSGDLRVLTRHNAVSATAAHISIIGHITCQELRAGLSDVEVANGFANRFLWIFVKRSQLLPDGGCLNDQELQSLAISLKQALEHASNLCRVERDQEARRLWHDIYPQLSQEQPGLLGSMTGRAEAQVVRLSLIYSLLDCSQCIERIHLEAALEVWRYADDSVRYIFGDAVGDPVADKILQALKGSTEGLTRTDLHHLFHRHKDRETVSQALRSLQEADLVQNSLQQTRGRPREIWFAST